MRRFYLILGLVILGAVAVGIFVHNSDPHSTAKTYSYNVEGDHPLKLDKWTGYCGRERADVKHTVDTAAQAISLTPIRTTVPRLVALPVPSGLGGPDTPRLPEESHIYKIKGVTLELVKSESDGDYHMVLRSTLDPSKTMIAESIPSSCAQGSRFLPQITATRTAVDSLRNSLPRVVTITGIGYFDFLHGQTGVAPNGIELHPLLSIQ